MLTAPELPDALDEWLDHSLQWVNYILQAYPPALEEFPARRAALIRLDDILHIESASRKALITKFYTERLATAIAEIERTKVTEGMRIWKLYNHGFLVRTPTVSLTFDIVPGVVRIPEFSIPDALLERLVAQSYATFISHLHNDHANQQVARMFLSHHKPVIAPKGVVERRAGPRFQADVSEAEHGHSSCHRGAGRQADVASDRISGTPGPRSDRERTPSHYSRGLRCSASKLLGQCAGRTIRGVNPELAITGHENEMGHTDDHREDYTQTYNHLFEVRYPFVVMAWGRVITTGSLTPVNRR